MKEYIIHNFEAGRRGKPDEFDSSLANLIGIYFLKQNPKARFDLRVSGTFKNNKPFVRISGEVSEILLLNKNLEKDIKKIVLERYNYIYKTDYKSLLFDFNFKKQSNSLAENNKSGDSGNPIAVAYKNKYNCLPIERYAAVAIRDLIDTYYLKNKISGLKADGKISVEAKYLGTKFICLTKIVIALEHETALDLDKLKTKVLKIITTFLKQKKINYKNVKILINEAGPWNLGGWKIDEGSREAKPYRDGFCSYGVSEDSFSGEDATKPSATGTFLARFIAVQIVANDLASFARVSLSYTIGSENIDINIFTNNTAKINQIQLERRAKKIGLRISDAITRFNLYDPQVYELIVNDSDYFQNPNFPWNKIQRFI